MANQNKFVSVNLNKSFGRSSGFSVSNLNGNGSKQRSGGTGGGGMVVLSRPRSSGQKSGPRLSVPPPLNLPSLRKEHERFDVSAANSRSAGGGNSGLGHGHGSPAAGWTRTSIPAPSSVLDDAHQSEQLGSKNSRLGSTSSGAVPSSRQLGVPIRAPALRGEDFPSLSATCEASRKRRDVTNQKVKQVETEETLCLRQVSIMRPLVQPSRPIDFKGPTSDGASTMKDMSQKQISSLPEPLALPLMHLNRKSDWADDERDTGIGILDRDRERGFPRVEHSHFDDFYTPSREFLRKDSYGRDSVVPKREIRDSGSWRGGIDRQNLGDYREVPNYRRSALQENGFQNSWINRKPVTTLTNGIDGDNHINRNIPTPRSPFSPGSKGHLVNDPASNFSRDRCIFANSSKPNVEETVFDAKSPPHGGNSGDVSIKIIKKKKDAAKPADFYDPVRESFEVELQRVQQLQEMERQRALEEQTRAIEIARMEEEERERAARAEEEKRRKIEAEEREAAWRAEQEKLEVSRRAEEQRITREEEKKRIVMEEERRKEAAREKLLELEARIAKRHAEETAKDDKTSSIPVLNQKKDEPLVGNSGKKSDSVTVDRLQPSRDSNPAFEDKGRLDQPWRKRENLASSTSPISIQEQESSRRAFSRRKFVVSPVRSSSFKGEILENGNSRDHRWNITSETGELYSEFLDKDGDAGWRNGRSSDELLSSYYSSQNADVDVVSSSGRSRYSQRQPRVLPPPFSSAQRSSFRASNEHPTLSMVSKSENIYENGYQGQVQESATIPSFENLTISLEMGGKTSPRCTSQSSLSVTSPPGTPHDDLEDSGLAFSDVDRPTSGVEGGATTLKTSSSSISLGADDEWEIENNELVQAQEEYDEDNGYRDEDEANDGDVVNLGHAGEHKILVDSDDEGIEVKLQGSNESSVTDSNPLLEARGRSPIDLSIQPLTSVDSSVDGGSVASSVKPSVASVSTLPTQAEMPVKVQFGLFSGPSLIPPPVPAIQIGSIQMPLHLHPPVAQMHSAQSPFFQFGQMGLLPLAPQGLPFVHPSLPNQYPLTQTQLIIGKDSSVQNSQSTDGQMGQTKSVASPQQSRPGSSDAPRKEECSIYGEEKNESELGMKGQPVLVNSRDYYTEKQLTSGEKVSKSTRFMNSSSGRGKRYVYKVKNSTDSRPLLPAPEDFPQEPYNYQKRSSHNTRRADFRPRESGQRQIKALELVNGRTPFHANNGMNKSAKSTSSSREEFSKRNLSSIMGDSKRNASLEEDIDAPLQTGIIRIFKQPGIEVPSDEGDFIEVRSKRQMLNDRREQREKQNLAKSRVLKISQKPRPVSQSNPIPSSSNRTGPITTDFVSHKKSDLSTAHVAPLAPIGTPSVTIDTDGRSSRSIKATQSTFRGTKLTSGVGFENNVNMNDISTSLGPWMDPSVDQQVNILNVEPSSFEGHTSSLSNEPDKFSVPPIKPHEKPYSSSATSLSSVFRGERIQFGAVMSATILPPISRAVSRMSVPEESSLGFVEKEKFNEETLNDTEAEAEAAASAVAVAAISNDETVGDELGSDSAVSRLQDLKGVQMAANNQSVSEEPLTVALPADLSVETPLSLWPPLPSPQTSSGPMISCFPGPTASHFPCYEMNPMMGGPVFALSGPGDEPSNGQTQQLQRNGPAHLGPWPISAHSGMDSFYGPFITPPVGPPHMVVYNHFTPVGQFGQLGLGFMGAAYIPTGKQPDWKHSTGTVNGDGNGGGSEGSAGGVASGQQRGASPVLPMASPLTMFDLSPFQPSADMPVPAPWSPLVAPPPPLHSIPLSVPPPPYQVDHSVIHPGHSGAGAQFPHVDQAMNFPSRSTSRFPEELTLVETPSQVNQSRPSSNIGSTIKSQTFQAAVPAQQHYIHKVGPGGEWYRRQGTLQGKNLPSASSEKGFNSAKVKQIYVAKPATTSGASTSA